MTVLRTIDIYKAIFLIWKEARGKTCLPGLSFMYRTYLLISVGIVAAMAVAGLGLVFVDGDRAMAEHECHHMNPVAGPTARGDMASMAAMMGDGNLGKDMDSMMRRMMEGPTASAMSRSMEAH